MGLAPLLLALLPGLARADRIYTILGESVLGVVELETLVIEAAEGEIEVPRSSIIKIRTNDENLSVHLIDGTLIHGPPRTPSVSIRGDLYARRFDWSEVEFVEVDLHSSATPSAFIRADDLPPQTKPVNRPPPLRLELDLDGVLELSTEKRAAWMSTKLRNYRAEEVSVPLIRITKSIDKTSAVILEFDVYVSVSPSYDRMINLELELLADGFGGWKRQERFEVEEGRVRSRKYSLRMSGQAFEAAFSLQARPRIRLSLAATEA